MRILHTESSNGWGGQEMRVLREAKGLQERGHEVFIATVPEGGLARHARKEGILVYEIPFEKTVSITSFCQLVKLMRSQRIEVVNTHSSKDAWLAGAAARWVGAKVVRTRHLSTPIRKGLNSRLLYKGLADYVVTTSSGIVPMIQEQAGLSPDQIACVPTGIHPEVMKISQEEVAQFRKQLGLEPEDLLIGTACILRSWKGIGDFLKAAQKLKGRPSLKWVIVGGGHLQDYLPLVEAWGLGETVRFLGHLERPYAAIAAMDIFLLLSTANEGISQATLQAAYLEKPMITTSVGGLPEVCLDRRTGLIVPPNAPDEVVKAILELSENETLRYALGKKGRELVLEKFLWKETLDQMESIFKRKYG